MRRFPSVATPSSSSSTAILFILQQKRSITDAERSTGRPRSQTNRFKHVTNPLETRSDPQKRNIALPNAMGDFSSFDQGAESQSNQYSDSSVDGGNKNKGTKSKHDRRRQQDDERRTPSNYSSASFANQAEEDFAMKSAYEQQGTIIRQDRRELSENILWDGVVITEGSNPTLQYFNKLRQDPSYREKQRFFTQSGHKLMGEMARDYKMHPRHLLVRDNREIPEWANPNKTEIVYVSSKLLDDLFPGNDGFVGDFEMPDAPMKEELMVNKKKFRSVLVLDNISDAGQLGSMIRSAAAFAYDAVFVVNGCADLYHPDTLNSARGVLFQKLTPIYVLKSENGDDVAGMLNHLVERNDLQPVVLTPNSPAQQNISGQKDHEAEQQKQEIQKLLSPIARAALSSSPAKKSAVDQVVSDSSSSSSLFPQKNNQVKTLHQLCLDSFTGWFDRTDGINSNKSNVSSSTIESSASTTTATATSTVINDTTKTAEAEEEKPFVYEAKRHILCVSSDYRGNFEQRMQRDFAPSKKPVTTLLLEEERPCSDLVESFPIALYQLRHTAQWDFLPAPSSAAASSFQQKLQYQPSHENDFPREDVGPTSIRDRNLSEEEFAHMTRAKKESVRERRINKNKYDDQDIWRSNENDRLMINLKEDEEKLSSEGLMEDAEERAARTERRRAKFDKARRDSPIPDYILEMDQTVDRDTLREQERWAEEYVPPPNYFEKELKTPQWKTLRHKEGGVRPMKRSEFQRKYQEMQEELSKKSTIKKQQQQGAI